MDSKIKESKPKEKTKIDLENEKIQERIEKFNKGKD